ncbi:ethanolamine-phosphate phospho-lyase-like [Ylistrum balloti]|uniref:ethanolamine-phosphate phospho-lyase-like n=1 Tax=Ylistrum balloti TaxID=509963 RepID=UPI002905D843|nr:ethanolamine-phosphate phospho-lyase-like [Ylistrum balloti]
MEDIAKEETLHLRNKHVGGACKLFFASDPLKIVRASGQYMYDEQDQQYLDCINNVCHVGHCHPDVVEAGCKQMKVLNTNSRFLHDNLVLLAKRLTETMPDKLSVVYFVNSGSEANDLAIRLAKHYTRGTEMLTLDHAYHGHVVSALEVSPYKLRQQVDNSHPPPDHVHWLSCPDVYRGKFRDCDYPGHDMGQVYANEVRDVIHKIQEDGKNVSFYIAESMQSCGGQIIPPQGYLKSVYKYVREAGGICIADEVQVGFGRVGSHFWAFQLQDVEPDIVTLGKPMGNGHPVAAVITTQEISDSFKNSGMEYFNTYGGNPVSCSIALAVLDVIEKEHLRQNALDVGHYWRDKVTELMSKFDIIGQVRGQGLFLGIDLVKDRETREPATEEAKKVITRMKEEHILLSTDGPYSNVIKTKPPMCFSKDDVDHFMEKFTNILMEVTSQGNDTNINSSQGINSCSLTTSNMDVINFDDGDINKNICTGLQAMKVH